MAALLAPLVGRDAEVRALTRALDDALTGAPTVAMLVGEAGVGKSRLAQEALVLAAARGFLTVRAAASPLYADLHYGVIVESLRPFIRGVEAGARARLVEGLSDLGRLFDGLGLPVAPPLGDARLERTRLFEAVCRLFDRLSRQQPVLLFVDDIQWADPGSLAMLNYIVSGLENRRFLLVATVRTGQASDEADELLSSLLRSGRLSRVDVGRLDRSGVTALARGLLADEPPSTLTALLTDRTGGLPLFVRAVVTTLVESGRLFRSGGQWVLGPEAMDDVPPEVVGLLRARLDALDPGERAVVDLVAVAGGVVEHEVLAALTPDETDLLHRVRTLRAAGMVEEELGHAGVHYRLTHPLLTEVAYGEIPAVAKRRTHAAIASALGRTAPGDLGRLAHHVRGAGSEVDATTALEVLTSALDAALDGKAGDEAVAHADVAIGLALRAERTDLVPRLREQRAEALELAGRRDAAIAAWRGAAEQSAAANRPVEAARQLRRLALIEWDAGHLADSQTHLEQAKVALAGTPVGPDHLAMVQTSMRLLARRGLVAELRASVDELDGLAAATGSRPALAQANLGRADLCLHSGEYEQAREAAGVTMRVAEEDGAPLLLAEAYHPAFCSELAWGNLAAARQLADKAARLARDAGLLHREIIDRACVAFIDFLRGDWDAATRSADDVVALSHRVGMRRGVAAGLCARALLHARRGRFAEASQCLGEARSVYAEGFTNDHHLLGLGDACEAIVQLGRSDSASALRAAGAVRPGGVAVPAFCLSLVGEVQVATGDVAAARGTAASIAKHGPDAPYPAAVAAWLEGRVARASDDRQAATVAFAVAADAFADLAMPYEAAVARLDWAESLMDEGREHGHAVTLVGEHVTVLERLGARPAADRARRVLRQLGGRPAATPRARTSALLSAREAEIARLVAEGLSNPDIAARLFISQRTVTTHLQRIYQRLGVGSRTALTRYVVERLDAEHRIT